MKFPFETSKETQKKIRISEIKVCDIYLYIYLILNTKVYEIRL